MIESLLPENVQVVVARPEMEQEPLHPAEALRTSGMASKRLREFTLARACARRALAGLGVVDFPLCNGEDRAPIWPDGIVGSITHSRGVCAVAAARERDVRGIGLDAETLRPLEPAVLERITSDSERAHLDSLPPARHPGGWGLLVFSAKEAFYKCYYPLTRTFLGFHDAEIEVDASAGRFVARLVRQDAPAADGLRRFEGRFAVGSDYLATAVSLPPDPR